MKIIIDNGGTTADWLLVEDSGLQVLKTTTALDLLSSSSSFANWPIEAKQYLAKATAVEVYSTGVYDDMTKAKAAKKLRTLLPDAATITVQSDIMAACKATAGANTGIVCILGTGSNSCAYDGKQIQHQLPALGYIMGDEGSGASIGRDLIKAFLYGEMPKKEAHLFAATYDMTKGELLSNISQPDRAQYYLASHALFIKEADTDWTHQLVTNSFRSFLERRVLSYDEYLLYPIHFVGSIAYFCSHILAKLCIEYNLKLGKVIQRPIEGLQQTYK